MYFYWKCHVQFFEPLLETLLSLTTGAAHIALYDAPRETCRKQNCLKVSFQWFINRKEPENIKRVLCSGGRDLEGYAFRDTD